MIYTARNAAGATVYDVESCTKIGQVISVDTGTGELVCADDPPRSLAARSEIQTHTITFDAIHAIQGLERRPVLFHCYGRHAG